jgi:acid phosphatase (class A)
MSTRLLKADLLRSRLTMLDLSDFRTLLGNVVSPMSWFVRIHLVAFAVCSLVCQSAKAEEKNSASLHFIRIGEVDLVKDLPAPPRPDSKAQKRDLAISLAWQGLRTPASIALAQVDSDRSVFQFGAFLGPSFASQRLPVAARFFEEVAEDEAAIGAAAKQHWRRPRPFVVSGEVHPCVAQPPTNSYPSSHATIGMLYAEILARMLPEQRLRLLARARQYAANRVVCGVHFKTDIEAGKRAGSIEAFAMFRNRAFEKEFAEASAEIRSALGAR